jgi:hypothetical protein
MDCENVNQELWKAAAENDNPNHPNLFVSIHTAGPLTLDSVVVPSGIQPEILGGSWQHARTDVPPAEDENPILNEEQLTFRLTDPNMIVVQFTNPGDLWSVCDERDEKDAVFLSQPYWINTEFNEDGSENELTKRARIYFPGDILFNSQVIWEEATSSDASSFDIFPLTLDEGRIDGLTPWSGFHRSSAQEFDDHSGVYKPMTLQYLLDNISASQKGSFYKKNNPYIVYISSCNPNPTRAYGWNVHQVNYISEIQSDNILLGLDNTRCLKERLPRMTTRGILRHGDILNFNNIEDERQRWSSDDEDDLRGAEHHKQLIMNNGISIKSNKPCLTECKKPYECLPDMINCFQPVCKVPGRIKSERCKFLSQDDVSKEIFGSYGSDLHFKNEGGNKKRRSKTKRKKTRRRKKELRKNKRNTTRQRKKSVIKKKKTRRFRN